MISIEHSHAIIPSTDYFNPLAKLPYGLTIEAISRAMCDLAMFLQRAAEPFYLFMEPSTFSSMVSDYLVAKIATYSDTLTKNLYHNGHPDLIPIGWFPGDRMQYARDGVEVKASRSHNSWQGHNQEDAWLLVCCFDPPSEKTPRSDMHW